LTCTPNEKLPAVPGVPDTMPEELKERPGGGAKVISDHVYGGTPPVAASDCEYGTLTVPSGSEALEIESGAAPAIVRLKLAVALNPPLETVTPME
jgi:hypothetical protein